MPEKTVMPAVSAGLLAAGLAGVMQIRAVLVLALQMRPVQYVGAFWLSTLLGGGLTGVSASESTLTGARSSRVGLGPCPPRSCR